MPLIERYHDWAVDDQSHNDPHTVAFDHRLGPGSEALQQAKLEDGLAAVENNVHATCLITTLDASYGWIEVEGGDWIYDPTGPNARLLPTLGAHFDRNISSCVKHDRRNIINTLLLNHNLSKNINKGDAKDALEGMTWPADGTDSRGMTSFISRFPLENEYIGGSDWASGYHLGNGIVGTAGHCLLTRLLKNELHTLKVVFGWSGDVKRKRFAANQVFDIEKVILCDAPDDYQAATDFDGIAKWARKWDNAVLKLKGTTENFKQLKKVELASEPPRFGSPVYNAGHPLGTPIKISHRSHVLRHALFNRTSSPFAHDIDSCGTYTTNLDQFPGNSGGPVFDRLTGKVVGHTVSTQSAVSESSVSDIETWEKEFLINSHNYRDAFETINPYLARKDPQDPTYRVHPKFHRTLSGNPGGGALFLNTTFVCPGDISPNGVLQPPDTYQAFFNRHHWDSLDVVFRNLTGRIDRIYIFTRPLASIVAEFPSSTLTITLTGNPNTFQTPSPASTISITIGPTEWTIPLTHLTSTPNPPPQEISYTKMLTLSLSALNPNIPSASLSAPYGLPSWTSVRLAQPSPNPPSRISLELAIRKPPFAFPVDSSWPPNRPDVTDDPRDRDLEWPAEEFRFATSVGGSEEVMQGGERQPAAPVVERGEGVWEWMGGIDRVWRDPGQVLTG